MILIEFNGERQLVESLEGYEGATIIAENVPAEGTSPLDEIQDDGSWGIPLSKAEAFALDKIDQDADEVSLAQLKNARRQMLVMILWQEVQRLKLANAVNKVPTDALERAKQFPMTTAIAEVYEVTLAQAATAIENRFWDRIKRLVMAEAKTQKAREAVQAATSAEEKIAAAEAVDWNA